MEFAGSKKDLATLVLCSIRYSLGRCTYMPSLVQRIVRKNIKSIDNDDIQLFIRDINEADRTCTNSYGKKYNLLGDQCDVDDWRRFVDDLRKELEKRESK